MIIGTSYNLPGDMTDASPKKLVRVEDVRPVKGNMAGPRRTAPNEKTARTTWTKQEGAAETGVGTG